jgi:hypothetical protein
MDVGAAVEDVGTLSGIYVSKGPFLESGGRAIARRRGWGGGRVTLLGCGIEELTTGGLMVEGFAWGEVCPFGVDKLLFPLGTDRLSFPRGRRVGRYLRPGVGVAEASLTSDLI